MRNASSRSVRSPAAPDTASVRTLLRTVTSAILGSSASSGGKLWMASTADLMSSSTSRSAASSSSSAVTVPTPSADTERTRSMPSIPAIASSTRRLMPSSTSAGVAPG
jgi:hypothetical protein